MTSRIKKSDQAVVISGKDKGKTGKVLRVNSKNGFILIEGLNLKKRHRRARKAGEKGSIIQFPSPLEASKVMPLCTSCKKATRVSYRASGGGGKTRVCKKCGAEF